MRVVLDTSVYVAAYLSEGLSNRVLRRCARPDIELVTSAEILEEIVATLGRKLHRPVNAVRVFVNGIAALADVVDASTRPKAPKAFAGDEHLLACCLAANAYVLVTLDKKLLKAKQYQGIGVMHPRALLYVLGKSDTSADK